MNTVKKFVTTLAALFFFLAAFFGRYTPIELDMTRPDTIQVEIKGAVAAAGVYEVPWNGDVQTLIDAAGGLADSADPDSINFSRILRDREVVVIPERSADESLHVSINSAQEAELVTLPGIGPSTARKIIEYRATTPFTQLEDLMNVKGIGEKTFEKIRDQICL